MTVVISKLCGGLGNQLFQYAMGRAVAERSNAAFKVDLSWFDRIGPKETPRKFLLDALGLRCELIDWREKASISATKCRLDMLLPRRLRIARYQESGFEFDRNVDHIEGSVVLSGYWQSYKYFPDLVDSIAREVACANHVNERDLSLSAQIANSESVAIHVRRGDYVATQANLSKHGVCGSAYYDVALNDIKDRVPGAKLFLFSDDIEWCRDNMGLPSGTTFVGGGKVDRTIDDLVLMAMCRHQIIANSTFSWWAAHLNRNASKVVIAPRSWFASSAFSSDDMFPAEWNLI